MLFLAAPPLAIAEEASDTPDRVGSKYAGKPATFSGSKEQVLKHRLTAKKYQI